MSVSKPYIRILRRLSKINSKTIPGRQSIFRAQDILDSLGVQTWLITLDTSKTYHQEYIHDDSRFSFSNGLFSNLLLYEWVRFPFALTNTPSYSKGE